MSAPAWEPSRPPAGPATPAPPRNPAPLPRPVPPPPPTRPSKLAARLYLVAACAGTGALAWAMAWLAGGGWTA